MVTVTEPTKTNPNWTLIMTTGKRNCNESGLGNGFKTTFSFSTTNLIVVIFFIFCGHKHRWKKCKRNVNKMVRCYKLLPECGITLKMSIEHWHEDTSPIIFVIFGIPRVLHSQSWVPARATLRATPERRPERDRALVHQARAPRPRLHHQRIHKKLESSIQTHL